MVQKVLSDFDLIYFNRLMVQVQLLKFRNMIQFSNVQVNRMLVVIICVVFLLIKCQLKFVISVLMSGVRRIKVVMLDQFFIMLMFLMLMVLWLWKKQIRIVRLIVVLVVVMVRMKSVKICLIRLFRQDENVIKLMLIDRRISLIDISKMMMFFWFRKSLKILMMNSVVVIIR